MEIKINESEIFSQEGEYKFANEELALACLLAGDVLFLNNVEFRPGDGLTTCIFVKCNDIFAWGCADAENLSNNDGEEPSEIIDLYKFWKANNEWGAAKWCCVKRNQKPQNPVQDLMKKSGCWDEVLENLPDNNYDKKCKEFAEKKKLKS